MTLVRANASLPGLDTGDHADVDLTLPLWANRVGSGLVSVVGDPAPPATVPLMPDPPLDEPTFEDAVESMTVADVLAEVRAGRWDADDVLAAELAGKARSSLLDALDV